MRFHTASTQSDHRWQRRAVMKALMGLLIETISGRVPKQDVYTYLYSRRSVLQLRSGVNAMRVRVRFTLRHGGLVLTASLKF